MWTAKIIDKQFNSAGTFLVTVDYTDGNRTVREIHGTREEGTNSNFVEDSIRRKLDALKNIDTLAAKVATGDFTPTPIVKPVDPVPNPSKTEFFSNLRTLEKLNLLVTLGVIDANNPEYIKVKNDAKSSFDVSFFD